MPNRRFVICTLIGMLLGAFLWLSPRSADARAFDSPAGDHELTDADFCFGPGGGGVGFACKSACFDVPDPSFLSLPISCPGPPATMTFAAFPQQVSCGSQSNVSVVVSDSKGLVVADDTVVSFSSDLGMIASSTAVSSGQAVVSLLVPSRTSGVALVRAARGTVSGEKRITVVC